MTLTRRSRVRYVVQYKAPEQAEWSFVFRSRKESVAKKHFERFARDYSDIGGDLRIVKYTVRTIDTVTLGE